MASLSSDPDITAVSTQIDDNGPEEELAGLLDEARPHGSA
jgi:hypothetical protein